MRYYFTLLILTLFSFDVIAADISVQLEADKSVYENNGFVTYTVTVSNLTDSVIEVSSVSADFSAYSITQISASSSFLSESGDFSSSGNLQVTDARIHAGGHIKYVVQALVANDTTADIIIQASALASTSPDAVTSELVTVTPVPYKYSLTLSSDTSEYPVSGLLTYTLVAENIGAYRVQNLDIEQIFSTLLVENIDGTNTAPFTKIVNSAVKEGTESDVGTFEPLGDLKVTGASIAVGGKLTYTMQATLTERLAGDIVVSATSQTKDGIVASDELTTPPKAGTLEIIRHEFVNSSPYLVNGEMKLHLAVENTGEGIVHNFRVQHNIRDILTTLGNDLVDSKVTFDHTDISGHPYKTWSIAIDSIGDNSVSKLGSSTVTDDSLDDVVSVYPGETIDYLITAAISPVAIGDIKNLTAKVINDQGLLASAANTISTPIGTERVLQVGDPEIHISKITSQPQYSPGKSIEYSIIVENSSDKYFANNLIIVDKLSCIQTEQAAGHGNGAAFKSWKLEVVDGSDSEGTDVGKFDYGTTKTGDLTISPDIAPGKKVEYKLTATTTDSSIGLILDDTSCADDVVESGTGIEMPANALSVTKDVDTSKYSAGQEMTYTIKVTNTSDAIANMVPVVDDLTSIMVTDVYGNSIPAFSSWEITADYGKDISGVDGTVTSPDILDVQATIPPHTVVTYTIKVHVAPTANSKISNIVTVDGKAIADRGSVPKEFSLAMNKSVKVDDESSFQSLYSHYSKQSNVVTYQIVVENDNTNGFATDVEIKDPISAIEADMLEPDNTTMPVFSSWTISSTKQVMDISGLSADDQKQLLNATDVGTFSDNTDLDTTAQIPPNVRVIYTIVGQIDRSSSSKIVWGSFTNTATVYSPDNGQTLSDGAAVQPETPDVQVLKLTPNDIFQLGSEVSFDIFVFNKGSGYANDVDVSDDINGLGVFEPGWTIEATTDDHISSGSYADEKSTWPDGGNIASKVDIDPKSDSGKWNGMGYVKYTVKGIVRADYEKQDISNTANIHDPATNTNHSSTAEIGKDGDADQLNVSIIKTSDKIQVAPGGYITYTITLINNSTNTIANNLTVVDLMSEIKSVLANDNNDSGINDGKMDNVSDYLDQSPFVHWQFKLPGDASFGPETTEDFIYPAADSTDVLSLAPQSTIEFQIKALVKDNYVSQVLKNDAYVYRDFGEVSSLNHVSHHENRLASTGAGTQRQLLVNGVPSKYYSPGDELTYTVKIYSNTGYLNNRHVAEDILGVDVLLMDGTSANPFKNAFSVDVVKDDSNGSNGTTTGESEGVVEDNQNIDTYIDVAGGDYVLYTVKGTVRDDAVGSIAIGGITVKPNDYHLDFYKTTDEVNYHPGKTATYHLHITNNGLANAYNIPVVDELSKVQVSLVDGSTGPAYTSWTIAPQVTLDPSLPGGNAQVGDYADNQDINTLASIPMGATIDYVVTATINPNAIGEITNVLSVNGDRVSSSLTPDANKFNYSKAIKAYYDTDGTTSLGLEGYKPDGYIEYEIAIGNENEVHLNDIAVLDDIQGVMTSCYNITTGTTYSCPAFDSWTVSSEVDSSGITDAGNISNNTNIDTTFDLAAANYGSYIKYTVKAHIVENAVGEFKNTVLVNGRYQASSDRSTMLPPNLVKAHRAFTDTSLATVKKTYNHQTDDQQVAYHLRIDNNGNGLEYGKALIEKFSELQVRLAQKSDSAGDSDKAPAYLPKGWLVTANTSGEPMTSIGGFTRGNNVDIDIPHVSIAPGGYIEFVMESEIREDAIDAIDITPTYGGSNLPRANITPDAALLNVTKEIVSLGGNNYTSGDKYKPGDSIEYRFVVENTEPVWYDNTVIQDLISNIKVEVIGGKTESALIDTNISHVVSTGLNSVVDTKPLSYEANGDLNIAASDGLDIAPNETITFTITGKIREDAVGVVDANSATGGDNTVTTDAIPPHDASLTYEKLVTNTTADGNACSFPSNSGSGCLYNPDGQVVYQIHITNDGEGTANDVVIQDLVNSITTSDSGVAFSSSSVRIVEQPDSSRFSISGQYSGVGDLDAKFDLMAGDTVVFEITAIVSDSATGTISNVATINGDNTNTIVLDPGIAQILATKETDINTYVPGQTINYTIHVVNKGQKNSFVHITDIVSDFLVQTADGSSKPALENWSIKSQVLADSSPTVTDISGLTALESGTNIDINDVEIELAGEHSGVETHVAITITGNIRKDAVGAFHNIATVATLTDSNSYRVDVSPENGVLELSKVASKTPATYVPGETIGFDVEVKNSGLGYLTNVNISDLSADIKTDFAGQAREGQVFEQWTITNVSVTGVEPTLSQQISGSEVTGANGYSVNYNIAPSHSVVMHFEGVVNDKAMGDITNTVVVSDKEGNSRTAQATYTPEKANLTVTKTVDKPLYEAGDTLTYTIVVANTTGAWAKDVHITDMLSSIETTTIDGYTVSAFNPDSIAINATSSTGATTIPVVNSGDIDGSIEISPNDTLTITVRGTLNSTIHGQVKNTVTVELDGATQTAEAVSEPVIPEVKLTKVAPVENYVPGEVSDFVITVVNETNGFADNIQIEDLISGLTVDTIDGTTEAAFSYWVLDIENSNSNTVITSRSSLNEDIKYNIDLAPLDTVTFKVHGTVNQKAVGVITNTATMIFDGKTQTATAQLKPFEQDISFIKTLADGSQEGEYKTDEETEFHITLVNNAQSFAQSIKITDIISDLTVVNLLGNTVPALTSWDINYEIKNDKYNTTTVDPLPLGDDLDVTVNLAPSATVDFIVKGIVNPMALGVITNTATMDDGRSTSESTVTLRPGGVVLIATKVADKAEYTNDDDQITYTLAVTNRGSSDALNVHLVDEISKLQGVNGSPLFTEWKTTISEYDTATSTTTVLDTQNSVDLDYTYTLKAYEGNIIWVTIVGQIGKGLDDDITNTFSATTIGGDTEQASVTVHVKKYSDNEGELVVTKKALQQTAQVGDVVEYEVTIVNNNESEFKNVHLTDRYPSGFQYVEGSAEITNSGPDGEFDTADDVFNTNEPTLANVMSFSVGDMLAYGSSGSTVQEKIRIRYLMRVTVGATFGNYTNTAYAMTPAEGMTSGALEIKSNMSSATVEVTPDKLFDTASIIGKVFEDNNGDGYQASATAYGIEVSIDIDPSLIVTGSATLKVEGEKKKDVSINGNNIVINKLIGQSRNRTLSGSHKATIQFISKTVDSFAFTVKTKDGTHIIAHEDDSFTTEHSGNKSQSLTAENLQITRNVYQFGNQYLREIVIENMGIYEEGIPGVKLLTVEGIVIETDQYGRYHVPDQWVLNKKGQQFLVKLDTDSLPTGMKVVSENPKVRRITPNALSKFNFSVQSISDE